MDKIVISEINPTNIKVSDFQDKKAYLTISISNEFHFSDDVKSQIEFIKGNFSDFVIVVGDYLCRHNRLIEGNLSEKNYIDNCLIKGKFINDNYSKYLNDKKLIIHWKDLIDSRFFYENLLLIKKEFKENLAFQQSIIISAEDFIQRKKKRKELNVATTFEDAISLSISYILEELAIMNMMIIDNYVVQTYLGSNINILKQLSNCSIKTNLMLSKGIYVDLKIK